LVDAWIEVFNFAGAQLERLASAQSCQLAALQGVLVDGANDELVLLVNSNLERVRLMFLREGLPVFERGIPREGRSVVAEIERSVLFYRRQDPSLTRLRLLLCEPLPEAEQQDLQARLAVGAELLDHGDFGSLVLQGLAVPDLTP
jgi:hypothetical protein